MRKRVSSNSYDGPADLPSNAKLRTYRARDPQSFSRQDRIAYANAVHAAIRSDNKRVGQSYKPTWKTIGQCQSAYDAHMAEQAKRKVERFWAKPIVHTDEVIAKKIEKSEPIIVKPSILPQLLAEHFDEGARKLTAHLAANSQQSAIYAAISRTCHTLGI